MSVVVSAWLMLSVVVLAYSDVPALPDKIDSPRIVVLKSQRRLQFYSGDRLLRTYRVGLGLNPVPPKQSQGDNATPEGEFQVVVKNPKSRYFLSLGLNYPTARDAERGLRARLITRAQHDRIVQADQRGQIPPWYTRLGGEIFIHGSGSQSDWTWGCVALDDDDMRELYDATPVGTAVEIRH
jgi:murein L,D-transpeptidase YafK